MEKDYYITECLRIVSAELGDAAVSKGGTSRSKGWALVVRFSEDVDLFIDPLAFDPRAAGRQCARP
jgi:predicted nucleotidyltransferase component of viral defense system